MKSKLIGRKVFIPSFDGKHHGDWGVVVGYDGDVYHVAFAGDADSTMVFDRKEIRVPRKEID